MTRDEVLRVAELAHLELDESDLEDLTARMNEILDHVDRMRDAEASAPMERAAGAPSELILAADVPGDMLTSEEALANTPDASRGLFRVPASLPDLS